MIGAFIALGVTACFHRSHNFASNANIDFTRSPIVANADFVPPQGPRDFTEAVKRVMPSVVSVDNYQTQTDFFSNQTQTTRAATGSGVIIASNGIIVTNNHVVAGASQVRVRLDNKKVYTAKVLGTDPTADLAVLKIAAHGLTPIQMGNSSKIQAGQWVIAVGNPLDFNETVSVGVVSNTNRTLPTENGGLLINAIQTDAAINPGNSGGALTDEYGHLIGINSAISSPTGSSIGIGFAIPVNRVRQVAFDIVKYGHSLEGFLGMNANPRYDGILSNPDIRQQLAQATGAAHVPHYGIVVPSGSQFNNYGIVRGYPAFNAGIRPYDVLLSLDGKKLVDHFALLEALNGKQAGQTVTLVYWSKGVTNTVKITLTGDRSNA